MNKIIVSGRLVRDVEIGDTKNGIRRALFTIASNNKTKDAEGNLQAIFLRCIAWRQNAEIIAKYLKKGDSIICFGYLTQRAVQKTDGTTQYYFEVNVDDFEFNGTSYNNANNYNNSKVEQEDNWATMDVNDDDIPF